MSAYLSQLNPKKTIPSIAAEPARLEFENVTVGYNGIPVLDNLSFQVPHGAQVAVVGPNGAGKSTLFKALVGFLPVKKGRVLVHGESLGQHHECVAFIPQREEVDWRFPLTVEDVVMMGRFGKLGWLKRPGKQDRSIVSRTLNQLGIGDLAERSIGELSGGQQQRVFLARALAQEPHILLMDEPFTGVDVSTQEAVLDVLDQLKGEKVTVMISTHDLNLAATRFEHILLIKKKLIAYGPPAEALNEGTLAQAFGGQVFHLSDGTAVVDQCCPPEDDTIIKTDHIHTRGSQK